MRLIQSVGKEFSRLGTILFNTLYYAPKDEINDIALFLADVFEALDEGKSPWIRMVERLGRFYDMKFHGTNWREQQEKYYEKIIRQSI